MAVAVDGVAHFDCVDGDAAADAARLSVRRAPPRASARGRRAEESRRREEPARDSGGLTTTRSPARTLVILATA
jgi:hypothetical protein